MEIKTGKMPDELVPSIEALESGLLNLENINFSLDRSDEEIRKLLFDNFVLLPKVIKPLKASENINGFYFYRVRSEKNISETKSDVKLVSSFSHPLPENTKMNRANKERYPVLYAGDSENTAIYEAGIQEGDEFYVAEWCLEKQKPINLGLFIMGSLSPKNEWNKIAEDASLNVREKAKIDGYNADQTNSLLRLFENCNRLFVGDKSKYKATSYIAHEYLYNDRLKPYLTIDAILYPSCAKNKDSCNFAIHPDLIIDKRIKLHYVYKSEFVKSDEENINSTLLEIGSIFDESIVWFKPTFKFVAAKLFDKDGKIISILETRQIEEFILDEDKDYTLSTLLKQYLSNEIRVILKRFITETKPKKSSWCRQKFLIKDINYLFAKMENSSERQIVSIEAEVLIEFKTSS